MVGSMQSYLVFCRETGSETGTRNQSFEDKPAAYRVPRPTAESGRCRQNEICVNGQDPGWLGTSVALCVAKDRFNIMTEAVDDGLRRAFLKNREGMEMGGLFANAVFSDEEGATPVKVQEMDLAFEKGSSGISASPSSSAASAKTQKCRDCFELIARDLTAETNLLLADVTVVGTAAAAGILWLAVLSG